MTASATSSWTVGEAVAYLPELPALDFGDKEVRQTVWRCLQALGLRDAANRRRDDLRQEGMPLNDARQQSAIQVAEEWEQSQCQGPPSDACGAAPSSQPRLTGVDDQAKAVERLRAAVKNDNAPTAKNVAWVSAHLPPFVGGRRAPIDWAAIDPETVPSREAIAMLAYAHRDEQDYRKLYDSKRMPSQASTETKAAFTDTGTPASELLARIEKAHHARAGM